MSFNSSAWQAQYAPNSVIAEGDASHSEFAPLSPVVFSSHCEDALAFSSDCSRPPSIPSSVSHAPHAHCLFSPVVSACPAQYVHDEPEARSNAQWGHSPHTHVSARPAPPPASWSPLGLPFAGPLHCPSPLSLVAAASFAPFEQSEPNSPSSLPSLSSTSPPLSSASYHEPLSSAATAATATAATAAASGAPTAKRSRSAFDATETATETDNNTDTVHLTRRSHRQLDATRRAKESAALSKLDQLTAARQRRARKGGEAGSSDSHSSDEQGGLGGTASAGSGAVTDARKREKLTVLEASISHIERLQALVDRLTEAGSQKDRRMQELSHHLRSVATKCARMEERLESSSPAVSPRSSSASSSARAPASSRSSPSNLSSSPLSLLSASAAEYVSYLDSHHALYSSIFLHSSLVMMLLDLDTAVILDANSRFVQQTGFVRDDIIGRRINGKGAQDEDSQAQAAQYEVVQVRDRSAAARDWARARLVYRQTANRKRRSARCRATESDVDADAEAVEAADDDDDEDDELPWIESPQVRQYPSSLRCLQELREGKRDSFRAPWRCVFADGRLVEVESMCVVAKRRWVAEADGTTWERPVSLLITNGWTDSVPVDVLNDRFSAID